MGTLWLVGGFSPCSDSGIQALPSNGSAIPESSKQMGIEDEEGIPLLNCVSLEEIHITSSHIPLLRPSFGPTKGPKEERNVGLGLATTTQQEFHNIEGGAHIFFMDS